MRRPGSALAVVACTVLAAGGLTSCSQGDAAPADFCKSVDATDATLTQITSTPITKSGLPTLKTQLKQLDEGVQNLSANSVPEFSDEVDAVEKAAVPLKADVQAAVAAPSKDAYRAVQASLSTFEAAVDDLAKSSSSSC